MLTPIPPAAGPSGTATPTAVLRRLVQGLVVPMGAAATGPPGAARLEAGAEAALRAALAQGALPLPGGSAGTPQAAQGAPPGPEALPLPGGAVTPQTAATGPPLAAVSPAPAEAAANAPQLQQGALLAAQMQPGASAAVQSLLAQIAAQRALPATETPRSRESPRDPALLTASQGPAPPQPGALPFALVMQGGSGAVQDGDESTTGEAAQEEALDPRMRFVALPPPAGPPQPRAVLPWAIAGAVFVALFAVALLSR